MDQKTLDPGKLTELIKLIEKAPISKKKRLAYLYLIGDGSFSDLELKALLKAIDASGKRLQRKKQNLEQSLAALKQEEKALLDELPELTVQAAKEQLENAKKVLQSIPLPTKK